MSLRPDLRRLGAAAGFLGAGLAYLGAETAVAAAWRAPAYSYARNFVSDLGAPAAGIFRGRMIVSPLHALMNAAFAADGLLFLLGAVLLAALAERPVARFFLLLAAAHGAGLLLVGLVPETTPAPLGALHPLGALLAIAGGNAAIMVGAKAAPPSPPQWLSGTGLVLGLTGLAALAFLAVRGPLPAGLVERLAVYPITAWELLAGLWLLRSPGGWRGTGKLR
jgi:hypothetical membrane protein